jgi:hypothetical protein
MRRRPAQVACGKVRSRRFPLPAGVITVAVRWYLHAPRGASLSPQRSWEELEGRFLVRWLTWTRKREGTVACQKSNGRVQEHERGVAGPVRYG